MLSVNNKTLSLRQQVFRVTSPICYHKNFVHFNEIGQSYAFNHDIWQTVYVEGVEDSIIFYASFQTCIEVIGILVKKNLENHLSWGYKI